MSRMQQIKLFVGREDHLSELENDVNQWVAGAGVNVLSITGNIAPQSIMPSKDNGGGATPGRRFAPSDILVAVTYEKG